MAKMSVPTRILIVAALIAAPMLSSVTADAAGAQRSSWSRTSRISLHGPYQVSANTSFRMWGRLDSGKRYCRSHSKIQLLKLGGGTAGTAKTDRSGNFSFHTRIGHQTTFKAFFAGKQKGVHPDIKICTKSVSYKVTVRVG